MNDEKLYFNGEELDLIPSSVIAKTLQVNDIASLTNRQTNFTRTIQIPKTQKNINIFKHLDTIGNQSMIPYEKNVVDYLIGNDVIIYKGWGVVNSTDDNYNLTIYDGQIDFYKAIENDTFSNINLSELQHTKTTATIVNSWSGTTPYKYIIADYGGKTTFSSDSIINTDYLIPSISVAYLWSKIFSNYSSTYSGAIFSDLDFTSLYLTYPKGVTEVLLTQKYNSPYNSFEYGSGFHNSRYMSNAGSTLLNSIGADINAKHFKVGVSGDYKVEISGSIQASLPSSTAEIKGDLIIAKNNDGKTSDQAVIYKYIKKDILSTSFTDVTSTINLNLSASDSFCLIFRRNDGVNEIVTVNQSNFKFVISKIDGQKTDLELALANYKIKDFMNEIVIRFGLTSFKDKYTNHYTFKTIDERVTTTDLVNWSDKLVSKVNEKYIIGDYAIDNQFKFNYNTENSTYNDGVLSVNNKNLSTEKIQFTSSTYSPDKDKTFFIAQKTNVYQLWGKEISEDDDKPIIKYKGLDNHYYFLKNNNVSFSTRRLGSEVIGDIPVGITTAPFENYDGCTWSELLTKYYTPIQTILDKSKLITATFNLSTKDIADFDFQKLYYLEQLGSYFIINKISNYIKNKNTTVELIKIDYSPK